VNHPTTYRTTGWPTSGTSPTHQEGPAMDPMFSKALVDLTAARPAARPRPTPRHAGRTARALRTLAASLRRWADRLDAPTPHTAPCS
jgi:hypothetical protein